MSMMNKAISAILGGVMLITAIPSVPLAEVSAASVCSIDINTEYQTIDGFGGMNHPEWTGKDLTDAQRQKVFGNGDDELGFSIVRIFVNPNSSQWSKAVPTAKYATEHGVTVFASPWEPPANLAESGGKSGKLHLPKSNYAAYAEHLNNFGNYMKSQGVNLYAVSVQNEPDYASEWTAWSTDETTDFLANYADKITSTRVMSPESFQYAPENASWVADGGKKFYTKILNNAKAFANCDLFGTHFYGTQRAWMDFPALENCGKPIWMTEVYTDSKNDADLWPMALDVAENMHNGLVVGNMSAYVWWYIRRSYGPLKEDGTISKRGYCMAQYSKFVRPGDVRIAATEQPADNVYISAYKNDEKQVTIVAINKGDSEYNQVFDIGENITDIDRYRTSANENLAATLNINFSGGSFNAQLPAKSVSTFVVTLDGSPIIVEPDENGYYFHDTFEGDVFDWTGHGSSDVTLSGRSPYADSEALLVQNREKAWNGTQKALNSQVFKADESYSFSVCAEYLDGDSTTQTFKLSLQYTDSNGDTKYTNIATETAVKGSYVQLANANYTLPANGKDFVIYVETESGTDNFYIDEAIGAVAGTVIAGPEPPANMILGDINCDGHVDCFDMIMARKTLIGTPFASVIAETAADVNQDGEYTITDAVLLQQFILGKIKVFPVAERRVDTEKMELAFSGITLASSYKAENESNPLISQYFGADPGTMEYNGRVYVYMTNDALLYENGSVADNKYSSINTLRCISSDDMVNWTDHGLINVAGANGAAKWAGCSWAPTACHKTINGKEKFFLYFANNANGIGVLTSDSPTGPWTDPIGKALISRSTANCSDVTWLFDPAVFVDDDGTGYLYFGGGVPETNGVKQSANPKTARVVKLGADMVSLNGNPITIDAPYLFEDSGINKINGKYYYSYCSNWNTGGNSYGLTTAAIEYMVSDSPMGPFTYKGELFKNIGNFFGTVGNNHHTIQKFGNDYYLFYHAQYLQDKMGITGGYRSTHADKLTVNSNGTLSAVTGTKAGVSQVKMLNPYSTVRAATFSHQGGITISGSGDTTVNADRGDWFEVSGVDCSKGAKSITIKASSASGAVIKVCTGSASGKAVGYVEIPAGGRRQEITAPVSGLRGQNDLFFVFSGTVSVDSWIVNY